MYTYCIFRLFPYSPNSHIRILNALDYRYRTHTQIRIVWYITTEIICYDDACHIAEIPADSPQQLKAKDQHQLKQLWTECISEGALTNGAERTVILHEYLLLIRYKVQHVQSTYTVHSRPHIWNLNFVQLYMYMYTVYTPYRTSITEMGSETYSRPQQ